MHAGSGLPGKLAKKAALGRSISGDRSQSKRYGVRAPALPQAMPGCVRDYMFCVSGTTCPGWPPRGEIVSKTVQSPQRTGDIPPNAPGLKYVKSGEVAWWDPYCQMGCHGSCEITSKGREKSGAVEGAVMHCVCNCHWSVCSSGHVPDDARLEPELRSKFGQREIVCGRCGGGGVIWDPHPEERPRGNETCSRCGGTGKVAV